MKWCSPEFYIMKNYSWGSVSHIPWWHEMTIEKNNMYLVEETLKICSWLSSFTCSTPFDAVQSSCSNGRNIQKGFKNKFHIQTEKKVSIKKEFAPLEKVLAFRVDSTWHGRQNFLTVASLASISFSYSDCISITPRLLPKVEIRE